MASQFRGLNEENEGLGKLHDLAKHIDEDEGPHSRKWVVELVLIAKVQKFLGLNFMMPVSKLNHDRADQEPRDVNHQKPNFYMKVRVHLQSIMLANPEYRKMAKNPRITATYEILRVRSWTEGVLGDFWTIRQVTQKTKVQKQQSQKKDSRQQHQVRLWLMANMRLPTQKISTYQSDQHQQLDHLCETELNPSSHFRVQDDLDQNCNYEQARNYCFQQFPALGSMYVMQNESPHQPPQYIKPFAILSY